MARRRFVPQRVRRPTFWVGGFINQTITTGVVGTTPVVTEAALENVPDPTLVRCRGDLLVQMVSSVATPGRVHVAMGLIVVRATALAVPAVPGPVSRVDSDWLWWTLVSLNVSGGSVAAPNSDGSTVVHRVTIDSKAMRKIKPNEAVVFVTENFAVTSTQTVDVLGGVRILLKR